MLKDFARRDLSPESPCADAPLGKVADMGLRGVEWERGCRVAEVGAGLSTSSSALGRGPARGCSLICRFGSPGLLPLLLEEGAGEAWRASTACSGREGTRNYS